MFSTAVTLTQLRLASKLASLRIPSPLKGEGFLRGFTRGRNWNRLSQNGGTDNGRNRQAHIDGRRPPRPPRHLRESAAMGRSADALWSRPQYAGLAPGRAFPALAGAAAGCA